MWDTIVLGSGIGGLSTAAALAQSGQRVLVLEQHDIAGGLTQTFRRGEWSFATGVHYIGGVGPIAGPDGQFGRLLSWLSDGELAFADSGNPYDIVRLPGFEFAIAHPESAYHQQLVARFPAHTAEIAAWFAEMAAARKASMALFAMRGMPAVLAWALRLWRGTEVERLSQRTLADALAPITDARLRAVLGARWGDYGAPPTQAPLLEHALVTGSYNAGAYFPIGGPARFAECLQPVIEMAGGAVIISAAVSNIVVTNGRATGVDYQKAGAAYRENAAHIVSAMGVVNTVACLDPSHAPDWHNELKRFAPGLSYISLFLGFEGDIKKAGASSANIWIYESEDIGAVWTDLTDEDAPGLFVSFPSLKDPCTTSKPTAEVLAICDASAFTKWLVHPEVKPDEEYHALKAWIEERLLAQFARHFPTLSPMVRFHELATPVTQQRYVRSPSGAMYGINMDAERLSSTALNVRTPIPGLLLAGQDVAGAGIQASAMSGLMAAIAIQPGLLRQLGA